MNRRKFVKEAAKGAGAIVLSPHLIKGSKANSAIRLGLLGCGSRGTSVANDFVNHTNSRVVAIADLFKDQLDKAETHWNGVAKEKGYAGIDPKNQYLGPYAYKEIANSDNVDVIIISSPDYFHVEHLKAVIEAGKHTYCEKPAAVDVKGCLDFIELGERAKGKISLEVGFQVRHAPAFREVVERIHNGDIGKIGFGSIHYHASAIQYPEYTNASNIERRIRRFYWDRILSGDVIVDQNIHVIDIANWALGAHPVKAIGTCGRKIRNDESNIMDNWSLSFIYPGNVNVAFSSVQYAKFWDVGVRFIGDKGIGESNYNGMGRITGQNEWSSRGKGNDGNFSTAGEFDGLGDSTINKAKLFIESIHTGNYHNQARVGAESALSAIMGRMAAYSEEPVTWAEMIGSGQSYEGLLDIENL